MEEIFYVTSTNGRWGLAVVGPKGTELPEQGSIRHVGCVAGMETYAFEPGETGTWVMAVRQEVTVHGGATVVKSMYLQSGRYVSLLVLGPEAVIEYHGYKRRGSRVIGYRNGQPVEVPATVLAAMGIFRADGETIAIEPPPPLDGAVAAAFALLKDVRSPDA